MTTGASTKKNLYELLGVAPDATPEAIQAAYEAAAAAPGLDPGQQVALKEAASVLSSTRRRALYDNSLRERELPPEIVVVEEDDAAGTGSGKKLWLALGLLVLVAVGWWLAQRPATKPRVQPPASAAPAAAVVTSEPTAAPASVSPDKQRESLLLGTWHCQGPLTGSGLSLSFVQDGTYSGSSDGQPVGGFYTLAQNALTLNDGRQPNVFAVEELAAQGLVISRGEGKRLACKR
jgi:curved DNA-binding protein CbpA